MHGIGQLGSLVDLSTYNISLKLIATPVRAHGAVGCAWSGQIAALFYRWLIRRSGEVCLGGLISGSIAEPSEPMVLGYSRPVLPMDAKDGADPFAFNGRSKMPRGSAWDALAVGGSVHVLRL